MADPATSGLDRSDLLALYRFLCLTRAAEERLDVLSEEGLVPGEVYRSLGQEAGAVAAAFAMNRRSDGSGDVVAPSDRASGAVFTFGGTPIDYFRQHLARASAPSGGREKGVHWADGSKGILGPISPLGTMLEVMSGITLAFALRDEPRVGLVFYGDGASSTGAWHEGLVFAAAQRCPLVLIVENNQWAFSTPVHKNTRLTSFVAKGPGYGIGAESVDGTDALAVLDTVHRSAERARAGEGTQLVELRYFRRLGHTRDDDQGYVDPAVLEEWERRDPIHRLRAELVARDVATEEDLQTVQTEVFEECEAAAQRAMHEPAPEGALAVDDVYTDVALPRPWTRREEPDPAHA